MVAAKVSVRGVARDAQRLDTKQRMDYIKENGEPLVKAAVTADSFMNLAHKLGVGADNILTSGTYGFNPMTRQRQLLEWLHRGSWLGGVAVDLVADDMTRAGIEYLTELPAEVLEAMDQRATSLKVWEALGEVVQWGRLYGGAICVALVDGQDPRTPLRLDTVGPGQFKGLLVLDRWMVEPSLEDLVTEYGPDLGKPRYYRVMTNAPALRGQAIHYSRVMVRHTGVKIPYQQQLTENLWGISVLERLYDRLIGYDTATAGITQLVGKAYLRTLSVDGMRDVVAAGGKPLEGLAAYVETMRRYQGIEGISVIDAKDKFEGQSHQAFSGIAEVLVQLGQQLSGALRIPLVRLFGQSPGGLGSSGESEMRQYYDHVKQEQVRTLHSGVSTVYKLIARSLGVALPSSFSLGFRPLWELTETDKATIAKSTVEAVTAAFDASLISQKAGMLELRQSSRLTGIFDAISTELIEQADDSIQPPAPSAQDILADFTAPAGPGLPAPSNSQPPTPSGEGNPARKPMAPAALPRRPVTPGAE